jgi:hypothetical protein
MACSPPPIPYLKAVLDKWVPDICAYHDAAWKTRKWRDKWRADIKATGDMLLRGIVLTACGILAPIWFFLFGTIYWWWKKLFSCKNKIWLNKIREFFLKLKKTCNVILNEMKD